jgi:hypothetical protein
MADRIFGNAISVFFFSVVSFHIARAEVGLILRTGSHI